MSHVITLFALVAIFGGAAVVAGVIWYRMTEEAARLREKRYSLSTRFNTIIFNGTQFIEFDPTGHAIHPRGCHCWLVGETIISSNCPKHGD